MNRKVARQRRLEVSQSHGMNASSYAVAPNVIGFLFGGPGLGTVFVIFGAVALFAAMVSGAFLVESKGRVLEDLSP